MNVDLEERLRRHYDERTRHLPVRGPGLDPETYGLLLTTGERRPGTDYRRVAAVLGAAAAVVAVLSLALLVRPGGDPAPGASPPGGLDRPEEEDTSADTSVPPTEGFAYAATPLATLPDYDDLAEDDGPMVTVLGTAPENWYRLQPDLDVAGYAPIEGGESLFCWRTPVGDDCRPNDLHLSHLAVPTAGGTLLVGYFDPPWATNLFVQTSSGVEHQVPIARDETTGLDVARLDLEAGEIVSISTATGPAATAVPIPAGVTAELAAAEAERARREIEELARETMQAQQTIQAQREAAETQICDVEHRTLATAIEAYEIDEGAPPASEQALVDAQYLGRLVSNFDVVDGEVVPAAGSSCPLPPTP